MARRGGDEERGGGTAAAATSPPVTPVPGLHLVRARVGLWSLAVAGVAGAAALVVFPLATLAPPFPALLLPWWMLALLFGLVGTESAELDERRHPPALSLAEIPLVLGLFFCPPLQVVLAQAVGAALAPLTRRGRPPLQVALDLGRLTLQAAVATLVFHRVAPIHDPDVPAAWATAMLATGIGAAGSAVMADAAVVMAEGASGLLTLPARLGSALLATTTGTCMALVVAVALARLPQTVPLLVAPLGVLALAHRAAVRDRHRHQRIDFLYGASRILQRAADVEQTVAALLEHTRAMFRADRAELVLLPLMADEPVTRAGLGPGGRTEPMAAVELDVAYDTVGLVAGAAGPVLLPRRLRRPHTFLRTRGMKDAMVVTLRGEQGAIGTLMVGDRRGDLATFSGEDLALLDAFAGHVGYALENGRLERRLRRQAYYDPLTALANRSLFGERVEHAIGARNRGARPCAVLLLDLDDFKTVNDSLGHAAGDQLLTMVAERLRACLRPRDTAARLGGDEFAVLLEDADAVDAMRVARRLLDALRTPFSVQAEEVVIRCSIGIVVTRAEPTSVDQLLIRADVAMYGAKARGKNRFELFEPSMQHAVVERHALKADLTRAVERDELVVHYQPLVELATGRVSGAEALVRWAHPHRGLMAPLDFIPLAEDTGQILGIGRYVLEQACRQSVLWSNGHDRRLAGLSLTVNLSVRQFQQDGFAAEVAGVLEETGADPARIVLEITESLMADESGHAVATLRELKELGVRLAIDDFGTGYSSLAALRSLPIDMLKIAKPFVDGLGADREQEAFTRAILRLGSTLDLVMIAEGIERPEQATWLRDLGCDLGQGFHFGLPTTAEGMVERLHEWVPAPRLVPLSVLHGDRIAAAE